MYRKFLTAALCCAGALIFVSPSRAQNTSRFAFSVGGGFTEPVRYTDGHLNTGWNANVGAGVNFIPQLGVMAEFGFNDLGLSPTDLAIAGVPGGSTRIYSATLNPIVHFHPHGRFDAYVIGGAGYYHRTIEFTQPAIATVTAFDPFYGFYPAAIPTTQVLGSYSQNKIGLNIGGGISVRVKGDSNTKFFAETRYHYIYTTPGRTTVLPVTFGLRW